MNTILSRKNVAAIAKSFTALKIKVTRADEFGFTVRFPKVEHKDEGRTFKVVPELTIDEGGKFFHVDCDLGGEPGWGSCKDHKHLRSAKLEMECMFKKMDLGDVSKVLKFMDLLEGNKLAPKKAAKVKVITGNKFQDLHDQVVGMFTAKYGKPNKKLSSKNAGYTVTLFDTSNKRIKASVMLHLKRGVATGVSVDPGVKIDEREAYFRLGDMLHLKDSAHKWLHTLKAKLGSAGASYDQYFDRDVVAYAAKMIKVIK